MEPRYTPSEAARILGVSPRTLVRYEERGIISPQRTPASETHPGYRRYSEADLDHLRGKR